MAVTFICFTGLSTYWYCLKVNAGQFCAAAHTETTYDGFK